MYLLDTNIVSELRKLRPNSAVVAWGQGTDEGALHLSAVTLAEIEAGIELTRKQDPARATQLENWANRVAASYHLLPMNAPRFRRWTQLMHGESNHPKS